MSDKKKIYVGKDNVYFKKYGDIAGIGKTVFSIEGRFFERLLLEWGKADFVFEGEDSVGRSKARKLKVDELIARCENATKLAMQTMEKNGWVEDIPIEDLLKGDE